MSAFESSTYLNATEFQQPHWKVIAQGFQTEAWFGDGQAVGTGGILMPRPARLRPGQYFYRFANSHSPQAAQLGSGWWLEFEQFKRISGFAEDNGYALKDAARLMLALPYSWTKVDVLIRAFLRYPLYAFVGEGKPARGPQTGPDAGTLWIPTQHQKIQQLYVPGLFVKGRTEQIYEKAFQQPPGRQAI